MALKQGNVTLTHFLLLIYFARNRFPTVILADVIQQCIAMMNQCFGNMKQDQIWCYDDLMIWWYKDIGQWFIPCLHTKKGQRMIFSCSNWFQLPWRMNRSEGFSFTDLTQFWLHGSAKHQLEKKFLNMKLFAMRKKPVLVWHKYNSK